MNVVFKKLIWIFLIDVYHSYINRYFNDPAKYNHSSIFCMSETNMTSIH